MSSPAPAAEPQVTSPYGLILVAVDGSAHASAAISHAAMLAERLGSKLLALHVVSGDWDEPEFGGAPEEGYNTLDRETARRQGEALLQRQVRSLPTAVEVQPIVRFGVPDEEILDLADARQVDLIVVGSRGLTGFQRFLLGSVSYKVARSAERPVLVIHV